MAVINEIIRIEADNTISFGNYQVADKQKINDFKFEGHTYKVRTHNELTRFERDDKMLLETVPGAAIHNFSSSDDGFEFSAEGDGNTQFTVGLEPGFEYIIFVDGNISGTASSGFSSKVNFGAELRPDLPCHIRIEKV